MRIPYHSLEFMENREKIQILKHLSYPILDLNDEDKERILKKCYAKIVIQFLRKIIGFKRKLRDYEEEDFPNLHSICAYYYFHYPKIYISSWIPYSGWKGSIVRPYLENGREICNRFDLFQLQMRMKKSEIEMIGW